MIFVLRMAVREARASWRRLLFFFVCVALGVGAIVALRSVVQTVRAGLTREARTLTASDVLVQSSRPLEGDVRRRLERHFAAAGVTEVVEAIETATMARPADESKAAARMVELKGVGRGFPLYGQVALDGGVGYSPALLAGQGALVGPELLVQLDVQVGDAIVIGARTFTIRGVVRSEPGRRPGFFSFGPRVLVDLADLRAAGLLTVGSRARYALMLRVPEPRVAGLVETIRREFRNEFVSARSYRGTEDAVGEDLERAENYLSLVGFVIVVLGGVGVWSVTRVFVRQKVKSIAVLKCVGATTRQVLAVYVLQVLMLGLLGSGLGVGLAAAGLQAVPAPALAALGLARLAPTWSAAVQGVGVGVLVSLLFSLVPLVEVRRIRPLLLLRDQDLGRAEAGGGVPGRRLALASWRARLRRVDWLQAGLGAGVTAALVALASWQAASWRVGFLVSVAFVVVALALHVCGVVLVRSVQPLARVRWFPLRHAVISISRPGNQTRTILLAVGLGVFFIIGVRSLQGNLLRELAIEVRAGDPDLFLLDIQPDQEAGVRAFLGEAGGVRDVALIPVLRARVTGVKGRAVRLDSYEDVRGQGALAREYVITYRGALERNERVVAGRFWPAEPSGRAEVSIEESIRQRFGIDVGDVMRFDVLGRVVEAEVTSVRRVDWRDARRGGFMFVFRPGVLDRAPHTRIGILRAPPEPAARARLQRDLVARFPNVSVIDVREVTRTVAAVLDQVTLAVSIVGGVAILSGVLILVGAVAMTRFERLHEAAVFKTLGASTRTLGAMLALEYTTLGALAGAIGCAGAMALTAAVCRVVLDVTFRPAVGVSALGLLITTASVGSIGVIASLDVLRRKPLAVLRAE
jgi:putative ABC transport system permease protein